MALRQAHKRAAAAAPVSPPRRGVGTGPAAASRGKERGRRAGDRRLRRGCGGSIPAGPLRGAGSLRGRAGAEGAPRPPPPRADVAPLEIGAGGCPPHPHPQAAELPPRRGTGSRGEGEPLRHGVAADVVAVGGAAAGGSGTGGCRTPACPRWRGAALSACRGGGGGGGGGAAPPPPPVSRWRAGSVSPEPGCRWGQRVPRAAGSRSAASRDGCELSGSARHPHRLTSAVCLNVCYR